MTLTAKRRLRHEFFRQLGPNAESFKLMFDATESLCFYMKDTKGRIMALNRRNCAVCNIKDEWDAIGLSSSELFPKPYAEDYLSLDREVVSTGKPIVARVTQYPADRSLNFMISDVYPLRALDGTIIGTARVYRLSTDDNLENTRYGQMRIVSQYVESHYAENLDMKTLIGLTGYSKNHFIQTFEATFNMTPWRYLTTIRLNAARKLLETTNKLLAYIAAETGFFDQSHLTRVFKKERGMTPGEYRRKHSLLKP